MSTMVVDAGPQPAPPRLRTAGTPWGAVAWRIAGWLLAAICVALLVKILLGLKIVWPFLWAKLDMFWLKLYGGALVAAALLIWWRRGKLLFAVAALAGLGLVLTPAVTGASGWAIPKLALVTLLAVGLGQRCLRWCVPSARLDFPDRVLFAAVLGFGVLSLVMFTLGVFHALYFWPAVVVLAALGAAVAVDLRDLWRQAVAEVFRPLPEAWRSADLRLPAVALACCVVCGCGSYLCAIAPATHWDVLHYHLGIPAIYVARGGFVPLHNTFAVYLVRNTEMLYLLGLLIEGQPLPALFNCVLAAIAVGFVWRLGGLLINRTVGLLAVCVFVAVPLVTYDLAEGLVDLSLTALVLAVAHALVLWHRQRAPGWLIVAGLLAGLAVGTKVNAVFFLIPVFSVGFGRLLWLRRGWAGTAADVLRVVLPALAVFAPWLVLTWLRTGNPVFPFLNNYFHSPEFANSDFAAASDWKSFGHGHTWLYALRLPWDLAFHGDQFGELGWYATAGVTLLGLPLTFFLAPRRERRPVLLVCFCSVASLMVVFAVVQYARYMLPAFAAFAILAAFNGYNLWRFFAAARPKWVVLPVLARLDGRDVNVQVGVQFKGVVLIALVLLGLTWVGFTRVVHLTTLRHTFDRYPWRLALGKQSPDDYLRDFSNLREYDALRFMAARPGGDAAFMSLGVGSGTYSGGAVQYNEWHSLPGRQMRDADSAEKLLALFREHHVGYLMLNGPYVWCNPGMQEWYGHAAACDREFLRHYGELLFARNGFYVYRIHPEGFDNSYAGCLSLLQYPDLTFGPDGRVTTTGGGLFNVPVKCRDNSPAGREVTLELTDANCVGQHVSVQPNTFYTLAAEFWSDVPGQEGLLQINWSDAAGKQIVSDWGPEHLEFPATGQPQRCEISGVAPANACFADIFIRAKAGNRVSARHWTMFERPTPAE